MEFGGRNTQGRLIDLVGRDNQGFAGASQLSCNRLITHGQAIARIHQKQDDIGFPKGDIDLTHGLFVDTGLGFDNAPGINDKVLSLTPPDPAVLSVPG
jgi:hypothetical protein